MSRNAQRFIIYYLIGVVILILCMATCSGCKTVHHTMRKRAETIDSIVHIAKTNTHIIRTDSSGIITGLDDYASLTIELRQGGFLGDSLHLFNTPTIPFAPDVSGINFPANTVFTYKKGTFALRKSADKKVTDSTGTVLNQDSRLKKDVAEKSIELKKTSIPWEYIVVALLIAAVVFYLHKKMTAGW